MDSSSSSLHSPKQPIDSELYRGYQLNRLIVLPEQGVVVRDGNHHHISTKSMEVLLYLSQLHQQVVPAEQLLYHAWGDENTSRSTLTHAISEIRHAIGDHRECPEFIQTIPRKGYRLIAAPIAISEEHRLSFNWQQSQANYATAVLPKRNVLWNRVLALLGSSKLFSVSIAFVVSTWVLIQALDVLFPIFNIPDWGMKLVVLMVVIGFPLLLLYFWLNELKMKKQIFNGEVSKQKKKLFFRQLSVDFIFIGTLSILVGFLAMYLIDSIEQDTLKEKLQPDSPSIALTQSVDIPISDKAILIQPIAANGANGVPDHFAKTIAGEIRSTISNHTPFHVVASHLEVLTGEHPSWMQYAKNMGARYLLQVHLSQHPDELFLDVSLIDTISQVHTWDQSFKTNEQNFLDLQKSLYSKLIIALKLVMNDPAQGPQSVINTQSIDAYEFYIQGKNALISANSEADLDVAEQWFLKALSADDNFTLATSALCHTYLEKYDLAHSVAVFDMAQNVCASLIQLEDHTPDTLTTLGNLYRTSGEFDKATEFYQKALEKKPSYLPAIRGLGRAYDKSGDSQLAERLLKQAIMIEPGYWRNHQEYGDFLYTNGRYADAVNHYKRVLFLNNGHAETLNRLGASYFLSNQFEYASEAWKEAVRLNPSETNHSNLGSAYFFNRDFDRAVYHYRQATNFNPSSTTLWGNLADAQKYAGNDALAKQAYETALGLVERNIEVNPLDAVLQSMRIRYHSELEYCDTVSQEILEMEKYPARDPYIFYYHALAYHNCNLSDLAREKIQLAVANGYPVDLLVKDVQFDDLSEFIIQLQQQGAN